jgi:hypothetical protein
MTDREGGWHETDEVFMIVSEATIGVVEAGKWTGEDSPPPTDGPVAVLLESRGQIFGTQVAITHRLLFEVTSIPMLVGALLEATYEARRIVDQRAKDG